MATVNLSTYTPNPAPYSLSGGVIRFARFGYAAKAVVYLIIGWLALELVMGSGGQTTGKRGALYEIASQTHGQLLLGLMAFGLFCYALWRLGSGFFDLEADGDSTKALFKRAGYVVSGIAYGSLGVLAVSIIAGTSGGGGGGGEGSSAQGWTAQLMAQPYGRWLVGIVGAVVIVVGLVQFYRAYSRNFMRNLQVHEMSETERTWSRRVGRLGHAARGVVYLILGGFLIQAAWQADASEAGGLSKALNTLAQQPYGPWLLGIVALGLFCYGIYSMVEAWYRYLPSD